MSAPARSLEVRQIEAERARALRARRREIVLPDDDPRHATPEGYTNWMCRCERCTEAARVTRRPDVRRRYKPLFYFPDTTIEPNVQIDLSVEDEAC